MKLNRDTTTLPELIINLWHHFSRRRKRQFFLLLGLMLIGAFMEVISLGAILPFIGILADPEYVFTHPIIKDFSNFLGINTPDQLVLPLTITFAVAALMAGMTRTLLLWVSTRVAYAGGSDLSIKVYSRSLYQPYQVHVARNSSEVLSGITDKAGSVVGSVLLPLLTLISSVVMLIAIIVGLLIIHPLVALISTIGFGAGYGLIAWVTRKQLHRNSQRISEEQTQVIKAIQEGLGGIRDVLLDSTQSVYCDIYRKSDQTLRLARASNTFVAGSPRYAMEALGIVLITILAYSLSQEVGGVVTALPVLGALALGAQRLLPALQNIYTSWSAIVGSQRSLVDIIELLDQHVPQELLGSPPPPLKFQNSINFNNVRFRYSKDSPWVLDGVNLTIPAGARFGFIGSTGSGKSTLLDLLMGLLKPTEGELLVDGQLINGRTLRAWQQTIAHVPQSIYLTDTTLAENIAFGVLPEDIDLKRVYEAAKQAQIAAYIESQSMGYNTLVGERGVRLSGGQRQRIGIARALYKQANILVFDEATSALDNATERSVMNAIEGLDHNLTILIIAHRLTTIKNCDTIVELENGRVLE
jgi:ATP-binding cassette, subfamily B, bacterial PglK